MDFLENNCLSFDPKVDKVNSEVKKPYADSGPYSDKNEQEHVKAAELNCNFKATEGRILKTVDSVFQNITALDECRRKCIEANFR